MTIYEVVANRVIDRLTRAEEKGETFNWVKPFDITEGKRFPCNYGALIPYTGINRVIAEADEYLTFNQIKEINNKNKDEFYSIRKGAKATPIVYFNWVEEKDKDGNPKLDEDGNILKLPFMKYYSVFSRQDVVNRNGENLPSNFPTKHFNYDDIEKLTQRELLRFTSMVKHYCDKNNFELQIVNDGTEAYFSPSNRVVRVPHISSFGSVFDYVSTVSHELVHSTGLDLKRIDPHKFMGREKYSKEELVAEIGASMLISQFRIPDARKNIDNPIAYIQGWRSFIKDNDTKGIIITAAQQAQKAVNMIFDSREILNTQLQSFNANKKSKCLFVDCGNYSKNIEGHMIFYKKNAKYTINNIDVSKSYVFDTKANLIKPIKQTTDLNDGYYILINYTKISEEDYLNIKSKKHKDKERFCKAVLAFSQGENLAIDLYIKREDFANIFSDFYYSFDEDTAETELKRVKAIFENSNLPLFPILFSYFNYRSFIFVLNDKYVVLRNCNISGYRFSPDDSINLQFRNNSMLYHKGILVSSFGHLSIPTPYEMDDIKGYFLNKNLPIKLDVSRNTVIQGLNFLYKEISSIILQILLESNQDDINHFIRKMIDINETEIT